MLKSYGAECAGGHVVMCRRPCVGGPCDYCVSPSPFTLDFGTLDFGTSDSGLTIIYVSRYCFLKRKMRHQKEVYCLLALHLCRFHPHHD